MYRLAVQSNPMLFITALAAGVAAVIYLPHLYPGQMVEIPLSALYVGEAGLALLCTLLFYEHAGYYCFIPQALTPESAEAATAGNTMTNVHGIVWQPFSIESLDEALAANKTVLIDFTAEWCLTCKVNEQTVINTQPVAEKLKALKVVTFRADWTKKNPVITSLLQKFGRSGVPLYVIFPAGKSTQPIVLPEVITQPMVLESLDKAGASH